MSYRSRFSDTSFSHTQGIACKAQATQQPLLRSRFLRGLACMYLYRYPVEGSLPIANVITHTEPRAQCAEVHNRVDTKEPTHKTYRWSVLKKAPSVTKHNHFCRNWPGEGGILRACPKETLRPGRQ